MSDYARVLILSLALPLLLSFFPPLKFYRKIKYLFLSIFIILAIFGAWDVFATWRGHWYFDADRVWPVKIINLPLEEWLFFVVITFCCIFTWEAMKYIARKLK
ncbi:MAG: lycopene cyclase domain-containing protein [Candidatus Omnitrophica bacterium]|jgi:lycopene cyclase domain-containing protein|nr:lycopene cyclase domain-containing protein [Candidatus Omnitrophota bacterium]MDD3987699.1 lycopene cyclase domain-containing protein [Candidatus Omnitrophota bacterium]MDD4981881.1 lycopene cyclase domain-containing protein [Candidatus Omnitrophota bacterium]MDD5665114.1 lycopene cyclase domain-containing protein [Candidatus Omnitrophota bacterium]